jgi:uncharacterized caspase-like protein
MPGMHRRRFVVTALAGALARPGPAASQPATREHWAVIVGISTYDNSGIPPARHAVADAEAIYEALVSAGLEPDNVVLLTDRTDRKPTLRNILWALGTFLARVARKDDTVVIYFAGHGGVEADPRGLERDGLSKYLVPRDADPEDLYSTALPMDRLHTVFSRLEAEHVIVFLDASYSGAADDRTFGAKMVPRGAVDTLFLERLTRTKGRAIVAASRPGEVAVALGELGHGLFTHYLLEGLGGAADADGDGTVSLQELYEYVAPRVTRKARSVGARQHPTMNGELDGTMPLIRLRRRPAP